MKTNIKAEETRWPKLTRAVIRQTGRENLEDIARHGCDGGFSGFTYYTDTVEFYARNKVDILAMAKDMADDLGEDMLAMIIGFNCLKHYKIKPYELAQALSEGKGELAIQIRNAMAWFAAEEVARELNPDI